MLTEFVVFSLLLFLVFVAPYLIANPRKMIFGLIMFSPIINFFWFYDLFGLSIIDITIGVIPFLFLVSFVKRVTMKRWITGRYFKYFMLMLSALIVPVFLLIAKGDYLSALDFFLKIFLAFMSYQIFLNFCDYEDRWTFIRSIYIAISITILVVVYQVITGEGTGYSKYSYLTGFYGDEGTITRIAVIGVVIALPLKGMQTAKKNRFLKNVIFCMSLIILGLALSRSATLAMMLVILFYSIMKKDLFFLTFALIVGTTIFFSSEIIQSNYTNKVGKEIAFLQGADINPETLGSGRIGRWKRMSQEFFNADLFTKFFGSGRGIGPHGQLFDLLRRTGLYGLFVITFFFLKLAYDSFKKLKEDKTDPFPFYCFLVLITFFALYIGATPLYNFNLQIIIFGFVAFLEKKELFEANRAVQLTPHFQHVQTQNSFPG